MRLYMPLLLELVGQEVGTASYCTVLSELVGPAVFLVHLLEMCQ